MFQPEGKFSAVLCPLSAGADCSRPYCHFKHVSQNSHVSTEAANISLPSSSVETNVTKSDAQEPSGLVELPRKTHIPAIRVPQYRPTPLAVLQKRSQEIHRSAVLPKPPSLVPSTNTDSSLLVVVTEQADDRQAKFSDDDDEEDEEAILKEIFHKSHTGDINDSRHHSDDKSSKAPGGDKEKSKENEHRKRDERTSSEDKLHRSDKRKRDEKSRRDSTSSQESSSREKRKDRSSSSPRKKHKHSSSRSRDDDRSSSKSKSSSSHKSSRSSSHHRSSSRKSDDGSSRRRNSSEHSKESQKIKCHTSDEKLTIDSKSAEHEAAIGMVGTPTTLHESFIVPDTDMSDEDLEEECLRLFQESQKILEGCTNEKQIKTQSIVESKPSNVTEMVGTIKKRIAHDPFLKPQPVAKKPVRMSPSQQLAMRLEAASKFQRNGSEPSSPTVIDRKRIATVSTNLIKAVAEKNNLVVKASQPSKPVIQRVALAIPQPHATNHAQAKGTARVAHMPKVQAPVSDPAAPPRPKIPYDSKAKVPMNVRQTYLEKLIDANNLLCTTYEESYEKSLDEERNLCQRSKDKRVYLSLIANLLVKHKKQSGEIQQTTNNTNAMSHADVLGGPKAKKMSFSIEKKRFSKHPSIDNITEQQFFDHLVNHYLMSSDELDKMGYPRPHSVLPGVAVFRDEKSLAAAPDPRNSSERTCSRCKKQFSVDNRGLYVKVEPCSYHWGKNWMRKVKKGNMREQQYTCCDAESGSDGCCVAKGHVFENPPLKEENGYCTTMIMDSATNKKVYALDCEMIYTTKGTELARVSVIDLNLKTVYETKVKPENPVLDYNTRFSGLKMEDLADCTTSIYDVQAVLLSMFSADCILVGHSLESDLKALKLIHSTVVDTSIVFPHKMGLPYKRALKNLLKEYCQKIIQDGVDGHDSAEDAKACMELLLMKVKQDLKSK